jgi:hypothetical protein
VWNGRKETKKSPSSGQSDLASWPADYRAALDRVSSLSALSPDLLHANFQREVHSLQATAECLSLSELESYAVKRTLEVNRTEHATGCEFCTALLETIDGHNSKAEAAFVDVAVGRPARSARSSRLPIVTAVVAVAAFMAGVRRIFAR